MTEVDIRPTSGTEEEAREKVGGKELHWGQQGRS